MLSYRRAWLAGAWLLVCLVIYFSLTPHPPQPLIFSNADKLEHALSYALLSFWFCQVYLSLRSRLIVIAALIGLGIGLEFVQGWTGYRLFDIWDMAANSIGVLLGYLLVRTPVGRLFNLIETAWR